MKISELMTPDPVTCVPATNLAEAAALMLRADCGILPVVEDGKLRGVVTDRDLFIALGTRDQRPSAIAVADVLHQPVFSCSPEDDVEVALELMKTHAIRRVPVAGFGGTVLGIVSMNDIILAAGKAKKSPLAAGVIDTMQSICEHHRPALRIGAA
ncbi:MAG TPA: CBS domain-containing protein [Vicinamibacterales bacterium]